MAENNGALPTIITPQVDNNDPQLLLSYSTDTKGVTYKSEKWEWDKKSVIR